MFRFGFSYPLLLLAFWTAILLAGDYVVLNTATRQVLSTGYSSTVGEIVRSEVGRGPFSRRGLEIGYTYTVNGVDHTGHLYRYDEYSGSFDYFAVTKAFAAGSKQTVYFDEAHPEDSVLSPGLNGCNLLLVIFSIPLNVVTFAIWGVAIRARRERSLAGPAGGVRVIEEEGEKRVRLAEFSPVTVGFFGMAAAAFVAGFLVVFFAGTNPSVGFMSIILTLTGAAGLAAFAWAAYRHFHGYYDLRLHDASRTVLVPVSGGRKELLLVPRSEIVGVSMQQRVSRNPSGEYVTYLPALDRAIPGAAHETLSLVNFGWKEEKARALAGWLSRELGVPFHGAGHETAADLARSRR